MIPRFATGARTMDASEGSPEPASSPEERLAAYAAAVRAMRRGEFGTRVRADEADGAVGRLGHEINDLSGWLEQRFVEFSRLREVATHVAAGISVDDTLERIYDSFSNLIPFSRIGCALISEDGQSVRSHWARSDRPLKIQRGYTAPLAGSSLAALLNTGRPRILNDLEAHLGEHPESVSTRLIVEEGIRASLTCPLVTQGKPIGFLFFSSPHKHAYRDAHQAVFTSIAGQLSALIEKSRLYQRIMDLNNELLQAQDALRVQATRDALTGILNRGAILDYVEAELARAVRRDAPLAVILADVDRFKLINDLHGHLAGDAVLRAVAQALAGNLRGYDRVGRYGGEEFLLLIGECAPDAVLATAERLRGAIASLRVKHGQADLAVSASFGVAARLPGSAFDLTGLIGVADEALYEAKHLGRNRTVMHTV